MTAQNGATRSAATERVAGSTNPEAAKPGASNHSEESLSGAMLKRFQHWPRRAMNNALPVLSEHLSRHRYVGCARCHGFHPLFRFCALFLCHYCLRLAREREEER